MPQLVIRNGDNFYKKRILRSTDIIVIGRSNFCDIVLRDPTSKISRCHAALIPLPQGNGRYFIRDLGSLQSTMVDDQIIDVELLAMNDIIRIGDYTIEYCGEPESQRRIDPLRVVPKTMADCPAEDKPTVPLKPVTLASMSSEQLELIDQLKEEARRVSDLAAILERMIGPIRQVLQADRGFARLFRDTTGDSFDVGVTSLDTEIEISDDLFLEHISQGNCVQEDATLLVPLSREELVGFFCVNRQPPAKPFTADDCQFLLAVGELLMNQGKRTAGGGSQSVPGDAPIEWPSNAPIEWPTPLVGRSKEMQKVLQAVEQAAAVDANVLLTGETGTGKGVVAHAIHSKSPRATKPFIKLNCTALPETLIESELFGHERGAFTGAHTLKRGRFELADGGTLFLDEIGDASLSTQAKLLKVLEDKEFVRLGGTHTIAVNFRLIAATNKNLNKAIAEGEFREDLYYRLNVFEISIPPLRERKDDVRLLAFYFLDKYANRLGAKTRRISHRALQVLVSRDWRGNVRELEHCIEKAVDAHKNKENLFSWDFDPVIERSAVETESEKIKTMAQVECDHIREALEVTRGNAKKAAQLLGYKSRQTILNKMDKYNIPRDYGDPGSDFG